MDSFSLQTLSINKNNLLVMRKVVGLVRGGGRKKREVGGKGERDMFLVKWI